MQNIQYFPIISLYIVYNLVYWRSWVGVASINSSPLDLYAHTSSVELDFDLGKQHHQRSLAIKRNLYRISNSIQFNFCHVEPTILVSIGCDACWNIMMKNLISPTWVMRTRINFSCAHYYMEVDNMSWELSQTQKHFLVLKLWTVKAIWIRP